MSIARSAAITRSTPGRAGESGPVTVVGTVVEPNCLVCVAGYGLPGWFRAPEDRGGAGPGQVAKLFNGFSYLVDLPD